MESSKVDDESFDELNIKHRKERKELQSTIQSLKKSASKGDKKKRKEILEEISRLEIDLEKRQTDQLNEYKNDKNIDESQVETSTETSDAATNKISKDVDNEPRISKAQKRRNKKALEEKQREADILAHEEENQSGPRIIESRAIDEILKKRNLRIFPIASDGDCLYNAIQHQLKLTGRAFFTVSQLRHKTADYILDNQQNLIFYMTNPKTGETLTDDDFIEYCDNLRSTPAWGGQVEITSLSNSLRVPIEVLQATGPPTIQGSEYDKPNLVVTYHRHMYSLGEHYNSTRPFDDNDPGENITDEEKPYAES